MDPLSKRQTSTNHVTSPQGFLDVITPANEAYVASLQHMSTSLSQVVIVGLNVPIRLYLS